jgi:hypothetical protein
LRYNQHVVYEYALLRRDLFEVCLRVCLAVLPDYQRSLGIYPQTFCLRIGHKMYIRRYRCGHRRSVLVDRNHSIHSWA